MKDGTTPDPRAIWESLTPAMQAYLLGTSKAKGPARLKIRQALHARNLRSGAGACDKINDLGRAVALAGQGVDRG